jgi:biotin-(acetyl-CoA carboxylase) ligase
MSNLITGETAILLVKEADGSFLAVTDIGIDLQVERPANRADIKQACQEILDALHRDTLSDEIVNKLHKMGQTGSEKAASSIRQALEERDIL